MAATKKIDFISGAFSQLRISGLTVTPGQEDLILALSRLEDMAYELESRNICTGYNFTETPNTNDLTNVDPKFNQMFQTNLAVRLLADFGKEPAMALAMQASSSLSNASAISARANLRQVEYPDRMPIGAANTLRWNPVNRFYRESAEAPANCETKTLYVDDINDYEESFDSYLRDTETVSSHVLTADSGLLVSNEVLSSPVLSYRVQGVTASSLQRIKIEVTTSLGRSTTRIINFNVNKQPDVG